MAVWTIQLWPESKNQMSNPYTVESLRQCVGLTGVLSALPHLKFEVLIVDAKVSYGNARFLVTPVSGSGEVWVDSSRVSVSSTSLSEQQ